MENFAELEITLFPLRTGGQVIAAAPAAPAAPLQGDYLIEMRFSDPSDLSRPTIERGRVTIPFDDFGTIEKTANPLATKDQAHGEKLAELLFNNPLLRSLVEEKRKILANRDQQTNQTTSLRIVLNLDPEAPELHCLHWESLRDYRDNKWLLTDQRIWFSRYLDCAYGDLPSLRPRRDLSAVVAVASPSDLTSDDNYFPGMPVLVAYANPNDPPLAMKGLTPVNVDIEIDRANTALAPAGLKSMKILARTVQDPTPVSLESLVSTLSNGDGYDILYLACHGALLIKNNVPTPLLLLEDKVTAKGQLVPAEDLVNRLRDIPPNKRPRLIFLASCQSAGTGAAPVGGAPDLDATYADQTADASSVLQAIGPRLAALGIPAVIAMQGNISMKTVETFMPAFFTALMANNGQVDKALTLARGAVQDRRDAWMPVLYLGLKDGRLWYVPSIVSGNENETDDQDVQQQRLDRLWNTLKDKYPTGQPAELTPIIGPGLSERILGSRRQFSSLWADRLKYPLEEYSREKLERVAFFLATSDNPDSARSNYRAELRDQLYDQYGAALTPDDKKLDVKSLLSKISSQVWDKDPNESLYRLASFNFPVYVTTAQDSLLTMALIKRGKQPQEFVCRWQSDADTQDMTDVVMDDPQHPVVFYLFGKLDQPNSLVLSLDDFLDYLIYVPRGKRIPEPIWRAIAQRTSLFLGYEMDDWGLRILIRGLLNSEVAGLFQGRMHVAVQVDPQNERVRSPALARQFLERYFNAVTNRFSVFWVRADDFIAEFDRQVQNN